ncbi:hypothetical protein BD413DRAFT_497545 [Trametes elegans]|nr:hypothetical protein BD413DRAFT_497545 [Trametes elegans]
MACTGDISGISPYGWGGQARPYITTSGNVGERGALKRHCVQHDGGSLRSYSHHYQWELPGCDFGLIAQTSLKAGPASQAPANARQNPRQGPDCEARGAILRVVGYRECVAFASSRTAVRRGEARMHASTRVSMLPRSSTLDDSIPTMRTLDGLDEPLASLRGQSMDLPLGSCRSRTWSVRTSFSAGGLLRPRCLRIRSRVGMSAAVTGRGQQPATGPPSNPDTIPLEFACLIRGSSHRCPSRSPTPLSESSPRVCD